MSSARTLERLSWRRAPNHGWRGETSLFRAYLEPLSNSIEPNIVTYRIRLYRRERIATVADTHTLSGLPEAKAWCQRRVEDLMQYTARTGNRAARPSRRRVKSQHFEVALHYDGRARDAIDDMLDRRMKSEAKRRQLLNPRRLRAFDDLQLPGRPARVWACVGDPKR